MSTFHHRRPLGQLSLRNERNESNSLDSDEEDKQSQDTRFSNSEGPRVSVQSSCVPASSSVSSTSSSSRSRHGQTTRSEVHNPGSFKERTSDPDGLSRTKRHPQAHEAGGSCAVNMDTSGAVPTLPGVDVHETEHNKRLRCLKSASYFGQTYVSREEESEKGCDLAVRSTLTSFANKLDGNLSTQGFSETDVRFVLTRFPELGERDVKRMKDALHFSSFAHSAKSRDPAIKELAGGLHAVLVGQEIHRVLQKFF